MAIMSKVDREQMLRDVAAAIEVAKEGGKVGIVGFCLGGTVAWGAAGKPFGPERRGRLLRRRDHRAQGPEAQGPDASPFRREGPAHPDSGVKEVAAAHPDVEVHIYPADHGFNCDQRDSYDAPSAALAWTRTIAFLRKHVGGAQT